MLKFQLLSVSLVFFVFKVCRKLKEYRNALGFLYNDHISASSELRTSEGKKVHNASCSSKDTLYQNL